MDGQTDGQTDNSAFIGPSTTQKSLTIRLLCKYQVTIYQETIQLAWINIFQECIFNTDKHLPHFSDFLQDQRMIGLGPVAPDGQIEIFSEEG